MPEEISIEVRLTLVEERLREGFGGMNRKLDAIMQGDTVNCTNHKAKLEAIETEIETFKKERVEKLEEQKVRIDNIYNTISKIWWSILTPMVGGIVFIIIEFFRFKKH